MANPAAQKSSTKAVIGLVLAIAGIPAAALFPLLGLVLGAAGLVVGLMSRSTKKTLGLVAVIIGGLAIVVGLAGFGYKVMQYQKSQSGTSGGSAKNLVKQDDNLGY